MRVVLSIKPQFAEKILSGVKRFEFRRAVFTRPNVRRVLIYATAPCSRVVGEFCVDQILSLTPDELWNQTRLAAGIEKSEFDDYFSGTHTAYALKIGSTRRFRTPLELKAHFGLARPPQSFCYVP
jgi:predicted transcriptional regulator